MIDIKFIRNLDLNCQEEDFPKVACLIEKTIIKDKALDKHRYLNEQIEIFYTMLKDEMKKKMKDLESVKKRAGQLDELQDMLRRLGDLGKSWSQSRAHHHGSGRTRDDIDSKQRQRVTVRVRVSRSASVSVSAGSGSRSVRANVSCVCELWVSSD